MKRIFIILLFLILVSRVTLADDLKKLSLDNASSIGTTVNTDLAVKTEGKGSLRITTKHPTTVCLGEVTDLDIENAEFIYKAKVKSELDGVAQHYSKGMNDPITGKSDWKSLQTLFIFQKGQKPDKVTLNLVINEKGTVWIDDVVLSKSRLK